MALLLGLARRKGGRMGAGIVRAPVRAPSNGPNQPETFEDFKVEIPRKSLISHENTLEN
jgi:hypothetical protein